MGGGNSKAAPYQSNSEKVSVQQQSDEHTQCTGIVTDAQGEPIVGASIRIKGTSIGAVTDVNGKFVIKKGVTNQASLVVTYLGYEDQTVKWNGKPMNIVLAEKSKALEGVVVTGIFERKKEGFTGSANRVSGDDIRKISSGIILNAITMLDPGFRKGDNMLSGSNPSSVPEFSMHGQSSMGDYSTDETVIMRGDVDTRPNQPLFVLDGIIGVSVTKIMDIDPAQIESITLLKDAAAMAIYGSQASNGVIVVETKAPAAGKLRVTYNGNYKIEYPDLTDYNLLNAAEKLELEKRAGFYSDPNSVQDEQNQLEIYRRKLLDVERGVNTYWLSQTLRTVFAQRHGLNIEGGTNELRYKLYAGVNSAPGIMKKTGVNGTSVSLDIRYRYKGLLISNVAYVDYTVSDRTSPYGTFNDYALLNPYYRIYDSNGQIAKYLERSVTTTDGHYRISGADVGNPMYNTLYNTKDQNKAFEVRDAFRAEYTPIENLRLAFDLTLTKTTSDNDVFKSANHTDYITVQNIDQRGMYNWTNDTRLGWDAAFTANYNKVWKGRHVLASFFRWNIKQDKYHSAGVLATGFPNDNMDEVYLGAKVQSTSGDESTTRSFGGVATVSYTYDQKYAADLNGRIDASSEFGRNNRYAPFWSAGLRWNMDKENWIKKLNIFDELVLRATYGTTGSQGFSPYQAHSYYTYSLLLPYLSSDGTGANILAMHNENLKWQTTRNTNFALELGLFDHRLTARIEHYNKVTNNLITNISLAPSLGFTTYPENLGKIENKGWEISLSAIPYRNPAKQAYWTVTLNGSHNKDKLVEISEAMRHINEKSTNELKDSPLPRYQEGYSMSSIWVVPSLGIDPATGDEILVKRNGELTNQAGYSGTDAVPYGNTEPTWQGYINSSFTYMGLGVDVSFRYKFGGQVYNQTLVDKVENANLAYNADRRVTQLRWQKPGDHAMFRALNPHGAGTKATSRFVMDENVFQGSTLSVYYRMDTKNARFIKNWGLSSAKLGFTMEDLFYLSSVKRERGLDYPFSRQFTFSLNVAF